MKINFLAIFVLIFVCFVCTTCSDDFSNSDTRTGKLVVDGSIELGKKARVILTTSLDLTSTIDSTKYLDVVTTRADMKISDGERTEYLTLRWNPDAFPQHYYESELIRGEEGKVYTLEIFYEDDTLRSQTTIPSRILLDSIWTESYENDSLQRNIWVRLCDDSSQVNFYRTFTRIASKQTDFIPTYLSAFNDELIQGECASVMIYKGLENFYETDRNFSFDVGDTVYLKTATIDKQSYLFWKHYEKEVFNLGNPFAGHGTNLDSNIEGGLGIWCGYNQVVYRVIIR